jgi:hypothetical protein
VETFRRSNFLFLQSSPPRYSQYPETTIMQYYRFVHALSFSLISISILQAATEITLTGDDVNSSAPGFGSALANTLNDPFAYDFTNPVSNLPDQIFSGPVSFHGNEAEGIDVLVSYTFPATTLAPGETFVVDIYGRSSDDCCTIRDDDFDLEFYSGGITGTLVEQQTGLGISNMRPDHLRISYTDVDTIDSFRIVAIPSAPVPYSILAPVAGRKR